MEVSGSLAGKVGSKEYAVCSLHKSTCEVGWAHLAGGNAVITSILMEGFFFVTFL